MIRGVLALLSLIMLASCCDNTTAKCGDKCCATETKTTKTETVATETTETNTAEAGTIEVLYMHGKQRCASCVAIGKEAEAYVKELGNSKVVIKTVDFSTEEGEKIADRYEIATSSLIVVKGSEVDNLTAMSFKYARNNPELFKENLDKSIKKMLE